MKAAIIFDRSFGFHLAQGELDTIWLIESPANRAVAHDLLGQSSARVVFFEIAHDISNNKGVFGLIESISKSHLDWTTIHIIGIFPNQLIMADIMAPQGSPSGIFATELGDCVLGEIRPLGFTLTKEPPKPRGDTFEIWRQNLPPRGLIGVSDRALQRIVDLRDDLRRRKPAHDWTPSLDWGSGATKGPHDLDWRSRGFGFALGFSPRSSFPAEAIEFRGEVEIVFRLGSDYAPFRGKTIDLVEPKGGFVLVEN